jgi:ion channel POLLUX/CASTOR
MRKPTFKQRFQYWFDNYMSKGPIAMIGGLAVVSIVIILIAAAIIRIANCRRW